MRKAMEIKSLSTNDLVHRFEALGLEQDGALLRGDATKLSRLIFEMRDIELELKSRPGDQRRVLVTLYGHPNPQVRIKAITATLAVEPTAREQLQILAESGEYPQAGEAGMRISALEEGIFKPT